MEPIENVRVGADEEETSVTVVAFPETLFNPFAADDDPSLVSTDPARAEASSHCDWDTLPADVMGLILDLAAANATRDYIALSATSKAWRRARRRGLQGRRMESLELAFHEEKSFAKRSEAQRKQLMARARGLRLKQKFWYILTVALLLVFGLGCVIGAALGFHVFWVTTPSADVSLLGLNCSAAPNATNPTFSSNMTVEMNNVTNVTNAPCLCVTGQSTTTMATVICQTFTTRRPSWRQMLPTVSTITSTPTMSTRMDATRA
jgi:hypothetical protein